MGLINNVPFDINRTPVEKNAPVVRRGTVPVLESEVIHHVEREARIKERRNNNRRKQSKKQKFNKRTSAERRKSPDKIATKTIPAKNTSKSGSIIDLEV